MRLTLDLAARVKLIALLMWVRLIQSMAELNRKKSCMVRFCLIFELGHRFSSALRLELALSALLGLKHANRRFVDVSAFIIV